MANTTLLAYSSSLMNYNGINLAYRPTAMNSVIGYRYPAYVKNNYYGLFTYLDPDVQSGSRFFICSQGSSHQPVAIIFVSSCTLTETSLTITGTRGHTINNAVAQNNDLGFPNIGTQGIAGSQYYTQAGIWHNGGIHYIGNDSTRKIEIDRTSWSIPYGTIAVLYVAHPDKNNNSVKQPIVNFKNSVLIGNQNDGLSSIVTSLAQGASYTHTYTIDGTLNVKYPGAILNGSDGTINKWNFQRDN